MNTGEKALQKQPKMNIENTEEIEREFENFVKSKIAKLVRGAAESSNKRQVVAGHLAAARKTWFEGREEILDVILVKINSIDYATDEELEENIAKIIASEILKRVKNSGISYKEVQQIFRILKIKIEGDIPLDKDRITSCSRYDNTIEIHITSGLTPEIFKEIFLNLLKIIEDDESIERVEMSSWFVFKQSERFKKMGFIVSEIVEPELSTIRETFEENGMKERINDPIAKAVMTRGEFLNSEIIQKLLGKKQNASI
jgi:hypothetical protein